MVLGGKDGCSSPSKAEAPTVTFDNAELSSGRDQRKSPTAKRRKPEALYGALETEPVGTLC